MKKTFLHIIIAFILTFLWKSGIAQLVPVYSQYLVNQTIINPAYAGANNCLNINALYRQQWAGYEGAPSTRTLSAHSPLKNRAIALGLNLVNDVIAVTSNTLIEGQFAYRLSLGEKQKLAFGIGAGLFINKNNLAAINVNDAGDEVFVGGKNTATPTFSFGLFYERKKFFAGLSSLNLTRNISAIKTYNYQQPYYLFSGYNYKLNDNFTLIPSFLLKKINGNPFQLDLNLFLDYKERVKLGASYRTEESLYGILQVKLNHQFQIGYSYDYSLNAFKQYHNGSHEVSVRYVFEYKSTTVDIKTFE